MSESGSESSATKYSEGLKSPEGDNETCRDYLRNVCKRGSRCKFRHPKSAEEAHTERLNNAKLDNYVFCHDYQNTRCSRPNCKFLHVTREEEEHCKQTGQLPVRLQQAAALGIGVTAVAAADIPSLNGEAPICKDYLKGSCKRGKNCKYRHMSTSEYDYELRKSDHRNNNTSSRYDRLDRLDRYSDHAIDRFESFDYGHTNIKRRRVDRESRDYDLYNGYESRYPGARPIGYQLLDEENTVLRRKVDELKKQVADLTATNEVLLEQNARYRISSRSALTANAAAASPQTSLNHLATSLAQQIALNSELASQHALQQRIARELAPAAAAAAQVAQGNLTGATLNQSGVTLNSIVPVSLSQNNLSGVGVSMAPVSIQQTHGSTVSQASMPQNMAQNPSTTLVSYPIVSQNMRMASSMAM